MKILRLDGLKIAAEVSCRKIKNIINENMFV
jgi:hypothetical protein